MHIHNHYLRIAMVLMLIGLVDSQMIAAQTPSAPGKPAKKKKLPIDESSTAAPRGKEGAAIEGVVLNVDGKPANKVDVLLASADDATQRWTTTTDDAGHFRFESTIPPGHYVANASTSGLESKPTKISVPGDGAALRLQLHPMSRSDSK
jgi:hypothetical protein